MKVGGEETEIDKFGEKNCTPKKSRRKEAVGKIRGGEARRSMYDTTNY